MAAETSEHFLQAIFQRRAVKLFDPVEIPPCIREQILDAARHAPSSFNTQPYKLYWVETAASKTAVSMPATSQAQLAWMRTSRFPEAKIRGYQRTAKIGRILFMPGPFGIFAAVKRALFWFLNLWMTSGMPPLSRHEQFKWAAKSTSLACQNLMLAAQALGLNTCPMEGFDHRRLSQYLGLSARYHEIVLVIAIGRKSHAYVEPPQWRRPLDATVTVL